MTSHHIDGASQKRGRVKVAIMIETGTLVALFCAYIYDVDGVVILRLYGVVAADYVKQRVIDQSECAEQSLLFQVNNFSFCHTSRILNFAVLSQRAIFHGHDVKIVSVLHRLRQGELKLVSGED